MWQGALDRYGTDLTLNSGCEPASHSGYWPATLGGLAAGFEFLLSSVAENFGDIDVDIGNRDMVATFTTHSDVRELKGSMFAAATFAELTSGIAFEEDTGNVLPGTRLLEQARGIAL